MNAPLDQALAGRHALVTGGARGIGLACAKALLARGAQVTLLGRGRESLQAAAAGLNAPGRVGFVSADIADMASVQTAFEQAARQLGPIHILVNNAGQASSQPFARTDAKLWRDMMAVNLDGTFHCMQAALPGMLAAGWGRIINVASTAGLIGYAYVSAYAAAKHGVIGLTRSAAIEYATKGLRINAICPAHTRTAMVDGFVRLSGVPEAEALAELTRGVPMKRVAEVEEITTAILFAADPANSFMTGHALAVDGGIGAI